ncbi:hypothetical protein ACE7GA_04455 [Roseomonas sp. CCTCC AB2023176]|uniref:hypothetical protein n=1 Tax=Roseomonas sp. CCTCC AB2023176 TaxID=3342640 RepID=UPI0035D6DF5A
MHDEAWRAALAAAVRSALTEGMRGADDPMAFLGASREQLGALVREMTIRADGAPDGEVNLAVAQEVEQAIRDMMTRLLN